MFTLLGALRRPAPGRARGAARGAGEAESLLLNILPQSIADRLKAETQTIADQFAAASILFADVVDFTPLSERLKPAEVVGVLDHLFSHFDLLAERYGVEKIKTIGDCYMVAAGVPSPRADHARVLALMALDMRDVDALERRDRPSGARAADRDQLRAGRGRRDRPEAVPVRPLGRCREHGESYGVPRDPGTDPDHPGDEASCSSDEFDLRVEGDDPGQGQGRVDAWYLVGRRAGPAAEALARPEPTRSPEAVPGA